MRNGQHVCGGQRRAIRKFSPSTVWGLGLGDETRGVGLGSKRSFLGAISLALMKKIQFSDATLDLTYLHLNLHSAPSLPHSSFCLFFCY